MYRFVFKMALNSLMQRRSRSLLVVLMISTSLWGLLFMEGIYDGMTEQLIANAIRSGSGDVVLYSKGYRREQDIKRAIANHAEILQVIAGDPRVASYSTRIMQDGLLATARGSRPARIIGVHPEMEKRHARLDEYMEQGEFDFGGEGERAIIGARLAEKLNLKIGAKIVISAQNSVDEVTSIALRVGGMIRANNMGFDETAVLVSFARANDMLFMQGAVSQISILLHDQSDAHGVQESLLRQFSTIEAFRWDEIAPVLLQSRQMMAIFNQVTSGLVFCVAGLGIFGVVLVSVLERMREFGIMLAVGTRFRQIGLLIFYESMLLGLTGFALGAALGGSTLLYLQSHGLDLSLMSEGLNAFGLDSMVYAVIRWNYFSMAFGAVLGSIILSTVIPLRILRKAKPIKAISEM